jgi:hypothetical protein
VVKPRRGQARAVFRRAIDRGEIPADTNIEVAIDLLYGPLYHRLLHRYAPLNGRFTQDVIEMALGAIQPTTGQAAPLVTADDAQLASALAHPPPTRQFW